MHSPRPHLCTFCETPQWTAVWSGPNADVFTCDHCAVEVLPALIADAVYRPSIVTVDRQHIESCLDKLIATYWRALYFLSDHATRIEKE